MFQAWIFFTLIVLFPVHVCAQVIDLSHDKNKNGPSVSTLVLSGEPTRQLSTILIADTGGYREALIGTYFTQGSFTIMPHVGLECVRGSGCKGRVFVTTSLSIDQSGRLIFSSVNEFGGVTGNFYKSTLSYQLSQAWKTTLVYHSVAGWGGRVDFIADRQATPYLQMLERRVTAGVSLRH